MAAHPGMSKRRHLAGAVLLGAFALLAGGAASAQDDAPLLRPSGPVKDPHYGDALFELERQRPCSALTSLMVSQHFGRLSRQAGEAELLRGNLLLACGLHRQATEVFTRLTGPAAAPALREGAWFQLARLRHQRGLFAEAREALGRVGANLPPGLRDELPLLQAQVLMAEGDFAGAAKLLEAAQARPGARGTVAAAYLRHNLGVALIRSGDSQRGSPILEELGRRPETGDPAVAPAEQEELRSLRDRTNVALGLNALQEGRPNHALAHLQRVRLAGPESSTALLGFGWAAAAEGQYKQALVPWLELTQREPSDAAVLEAQLAVPYVYAQLGAYGQSLERYQAALAAYEREAAKLDASIVAVRAGTLLDALIKRNPAAGAGGSWRIDALPQQELPHAAQLAPLFAQHRFQEAFENYRDLRLLARELEDGQDKQGLFAGLLDERRRAFAERLPPRRIEAATVELAALRKRRDALAAELAAAQAVPDGYAFADARQRALLARIDSLRSALKAGRAGEPVAGARERARLLAGTLAWDLAREQPARLLAAKQALHTVDAALARAEQRNAALARARREEPARLDGLAARNAELGRRAQALLPRLAALAAEQQGQVQELAVAELQRRKEMLAGYVTQARFAIAQLYDRAATEREAERALVR